MHTLFPWSLLLRRKGVGVQQARRGGGGADMGTHRNTHHPSSIPNSRRPYQTRLQPNVGVPGSGVGDRRAQPATEAEMG